MIISNMTTRELIRFLKSIETAPKEFSIFSIGNEMLAQIAAFTSVVCSHAVMFFEVVIPDVVEIVFNQILICPVNDSVCINHFKEI
jgi:hypothetical protein